MNFIVCEQIHSDREGNKYFTKILINIEKIQYVKPHIDNTISVCLVDNTVNCGCLYLNISFDRFEQILKECNRR